PVSEPSTVEAGPSVALASLELTRDDEVASEELDWEPRATASKHEELDEVSIAAIEADIAAMEADLQAEVKKEEAEAKDAPVERIAGESNLVTPPPVEAPKLSPLPPAPTMAVIVARGA